MKISRKVQYYFIALLVVTSAFGSSLVGINLGFAKLSPYRVLGLLLSFALLIHATTSILSGHHTKKVEWVFVLDRKSVV